jgi:branched-chain amino acid transport system ATP-binding protein
MGYLRPLQGSVRFDGEDVTGQPTHQIVRRGMSAVLQGRTAFGRLTVRENLELGGYVLDGGARRRRVDALCAQFPVLAERQHAPASSLSSGQQQMLEIARALMLGPRLLVLDEPAIGLSPVALGGLVRSLVELQRAGLAILLIEQEANESLCFVDRVYRLHHGLMGAASAGPHASPGGAHRCEPGSESHDAVSGPA